MQWDVPVGDPAGMREKAAQMALQCQRLTAASGRLQEAAAAMLYRGPAGDDLRRVMAERRGRLEHAVREVEVLRWALLREAASLEADQRAVDRLLRQLTGT